MDHKKTQENIKGHGIEVQGQSASKVIEATHVWSQEQLTFFRNKLRTKKTLLLEQEKNLSQQALQQLSASGVGELSSVRLHNSDMASNQAEQETLLKIAATEASELMQIEAALERLDNGTYGHCRQCESGIPFSRLEAVPETQLCLKCQNSKEIAKKNRKRPHETDDAEVDNFGRLNLDN